MLSLETCLKLKEAGWPQDGAWLFIKSGLTRVDWNTLPPVLVPRILTEHSNHYRGEHIAACPSLEELLEAVEGADNVWEVGVSKAGGQSWAWVTLRDGSVFGTGKDLELPETQPEAVAALWFKLKAGSE